VFCIVCFAVVLKPLVAEGGGSAPATNGGLP